MDKVYYLQNRTILKMHGPDAIQFLNSLCTNNLTNLTEKESKYSTILNQQSRFLYDFFVYKQDDNTIFIDIFYNFANNFISFLQKYKFKSKYEIEKVENVQVAVGQTKMDCLFYYPDNRKDTLWYRNIINATENNNNDEYDDFLIQNCIPAGEWLEQEKSFILEFGFEEMNAVDYNKGCYIGQELITRTKRIGEIRKKPALVSEKNLTETDKIIKKSNNSDLVLVLSRLSADQNV